MAVHSAGPDASPAGISVSRLLSNNPEAKEKHTEISETDYREEGLPRISNSIASAKTFPYTSGSMASVVGGLEYGKSNNDRSRPVLGQVETQSPGDTVASKSVEKRSKFSRL
ncbi:hypothetical protein B0H14DRAFT_2642249 [Mycena olivaceomarginata]|nr:hypothetical protein B0H14DRAFT_2642249 [Mycena olivaceomarginata]